tara:strand:- start:37 stop:252 length:216 start_codon:yes stop_codon:yes gene_type:complete
MNFLACDGIWSVGAGGEALCNGTPVSITGEEMRTELQLTQPLTDDEYFQLKDATLSLFVVVFGFLLLKKVL